jgi:hypothetical protein
MGRDDARPTHNHSQQVLQRCGLSESAPLLDCEGIEEAFRQLGDRLAKRRAFKIATGL